MSARRIRAWKTIAFLTGRGQFVDDIRLPGEVHAAFVRSPHAHARIGTIATARARSMPGVLAVLTGEDWRRDGGGDTDVLWDITSHDGTPMALARRPVFATDEARHVGDTVALVVAEDPHTAADAAAAVDVAWEPLASVTDLAAAALAGAPLVHQEFGSNVSYDWRLGDAEAVKAAFAAAHVTALKLVNNRLAPSAIEPRAAIGAYDRGSERYTLWSTTQNPHLVRQWLSRDTLRAPEQSIRVVAPDVGGGFGQKTYHYPEEASLPWAARLVGRPVRWTATRAETLTVDIHARDHVTEARMAFDEDGLIVAIEAEIIANLGAYQSQFAACIPSLFCVTMFSGQYAIPALHCRVLGVYTNTTPVDAYRGAGNPEITYVIERLIENGARELARDSVEARASNLVPAADMPYGSCDRRHLRCRRLSGGSRQGSCARQTRRAPGRADAAPGRRRADGDRHGGLRSLRRCRAEPPRGRPRQPHGVLGRRHRACPPQRQDHLALRQPQPRPVPCHDVCADRRRPLRLRARRH